MLSTIAVTNFLQKPIGKSEKTERCITVLCASRSHMSVHYLLNYAGENDDNREKIGIDKALLVVLEVCGKRK